MIISCMTGMRRMADIGCMVFFHAERALHNARRDFNLNFIERDIIRKHMFPLNITPPKFRESWIVTWADKLCAAEETTRAVRLAFTKTARG